MAPRRAAARTGRNDERSRISPAGGKVLDVAYFPSSERSWRTRKCRRLPNITSRRTSNDQLSPITSTAALIGQPERGPGVRLPCYRWYLQLAITWTRVRLLSTATILEDADVRHHLPHVDLARRLRRRARPESRGPPRQTGQGAPRLAPRRRARQRGRRDGDRLADAPAWRLPHGTQHVRANPGRVEGGLARVVGARAALPRAGVRAHPSFARAGRDGGRHDLPLRHRGLRRRLRTGARDGRRRRGGHRGRRLDGAAGAHRRGHRRADARRRAGPARVRRANLRRRGVLRTGARRGAAFAAGHAHPLPPGWVSHQTGPGLKRPWMGHRRVPAKPFTPFDSGRRL